MSLPAGGSVIHPAVTRVLERRPVLAWAYDNDPKMHEQVRQLNVVLLALAKHVPDQWLADQLLDDPMLLPTDRVLLQRRQVMSERLVRAMNALPPVVVSRVEPCPECAQGKHQNCTEQVPNPDEDSLVSMVPCPCNHSGAGVLVVPPELAQSITDAQEFRIDRVVVYQPSDDDGGL